MKDTFEWVKNNDAPFDIWLQESEIEGTKEIIALGDFLEYSLFLGDINATKKQRKIEEQRYIAARKDKISLDRVLNFTATMFGNKPERTITIMRGQEVVERWERKIIGK